jgi:hypothetical protein
MTEVTYAQLDEALADLGFSVRVVTTDNKLRVYEQEEAGARLALAYRPDTDIVLPHHLATVQGMLQVYGLADPMDFTARLLKAS